MAQLAVEKANGKRKVRAAVLKNGTVVIPMNHVSGDSAVRLLATKDRLLVDVVSWPQHENMIERLLYEGDSITVDL